MTYTYVMENKQYMEYLGFCEQKGFVYSEYMGGGQYRVLALKDGRVSVLIHFKGMKQEEHEEGVMVLDEKYAVHTEF